MSIFCSEWKSEKIGDILKERKEIGFSNLPLLSVTAEKGVVKRNEIDIKDNSSADKSNYKRICPFDIGYNTMRMWQGRSGVSEYEGIVSPAYTVLKPTSKVDSNFIGYLFKLPAMINIFRRYSQGLVNDTLSLKYNQLKNITIKIPSFREQKKIARILNVWDEAIALKKDLIELKKEQKKGLIQKLLTGKIRLPGFDKKWEKTKIGNFLRIKYGKDKREIEDEQGRYPILGSGGQIGKTNSYLYDKPSVLIGRKGTINVPLYIEEPFWTIDTLFYSEIDSEKVIPKWVYYIFCTIDWKKYNEATGVPSLTSSGIESISIPFPPVQEQEAIAEVLSKADKEIKLLEKELEYLKEQKKGLMQLLLTGKVRVKC